MSPRKSSTSSGKPRTSRARYLGLEVAGEPLSTTFAAWEPALRERAERRAAGLAYRIIRAEGRRAIVEVAHSDLSRARAAFNDPPGAAPPRLGTARTWGTLRGAKSWARAARVGSWRPR